jgi:large subunit ribosomal protein L21
VLYVDRQSEESGNNITFDRVLLTNDGNGGLDFGGPAIDGASVEATVLDHVKADKVIVFKKKRRKGYRKKNGHRQPMSQIKIEAISLSSGKKKKAEKKKEDKPAKKSEKQQVSTDMTAKEAISHIKDTPIDQLKGFVPESEDRVTVQRAWESKQEE